VLAHGIHGIGPGRGIINDHEEKNTQKKKDDALPINGCAFGDRPGVIGHGFPPPFETPYDQQKDMMSSTALFNSACTPSSYGKWP
jgi:hypothetical protein